MKKKISYLILFLLTIFPSVVLAADLEYVACGNAQSIPAPVPQLTSIAYTLLIIGTPLILIIFSIVALVKAITGGSQDDILKAKNKVIKKFIAAAIVFAVAGIVQFVITKAGDTSETDSIARCIECMLYNSNCAPSGPTDNAYQPTERPGEGGEQEPGTVGYYENNSNNNPGTTQSSNETTHTSSINGVKYNIYNQSDSRWGSVSYPGEYINGDTSKPKTISYKGCMITAVASVVSSVDSSVTPQTIFDSGYKYSHPSTSIPSLTNEKFKCKMETTSSHDVVKNALKSGSVVIVKVFGRSQGGTSTYTSSQHYMALIDISSDGNQVYIANSYSNSGTGVSGWHPTSAVLTSLQTAEICTPQ